MNVNEAQGFNVRRESVTFDGGWSKPFASSIASPMIVPTCSPQMEMKSDKVILRSTDTLECHLLASTLAFSSVIMLRFCRTDRIHPFATSQLPSSGRSSREDIVLGDRKDVMLRDTNANRDSNTRNKSFRVGRWVHSQISLVQMTNHITLLFFQHIDDC